MHIQKTTKIIIMDNIEVKIDRLFETSWEVCNKIGGIYTVLSTKAKTLQNLYKDKCIFIGPDVWSIENPSPYFIESKTLLKSWREKGTLPDGISVRVGRWDVPGKPIAVLVKFDALYSQKDFFYGKMWELYGVDSLHAYGDYDEGCAFALAAGMVIESICAFEKLKGQNVIAHFDEWTTGMGLLYTKWKTPYVATIFTTHATSIGRSICGNHKPLYDYLKGYDGDQMAQELNMQSKHSLEKAAAHQADCFTTVSDVTAVECEQLLQRRPDVVTPNGFENNFVPGRNKFKAARNEARATLRRVAETLLGETIDEKVFFVATSGRCEYRNKGIDVYLDSLNLLRQLCYDRDIVAFVMVPSWVYGPRHDLKAALNSPESAGEKGRMTDPVLTHWLNEPYNDAVYNHISRLNFSRKGENLRVIYVPCYLNGADGIFDKAYYDLLIGMDATVFPSYYEPWGYTPLESVAFGVPTVTTSLSGFGQWVLSNFDNEFDACGVNVVARGDYNYLAVAQAICNALKFLIYAGEDKKALISAKARETSDRAAWEYFIRYYVEAFDIALRKNQY